MRNKSRNTHFLFHANRVDIDDLRNGKTVDVKFNADVGDIITLITDGVVSSEENGIVVGYGEHPNVRYCRLRLCTKDDWNVL